MTVFLGVVENLYRGRLSCHLPSMRLRPEFLYFMIIYLRRFNAQVSFSARDGANLCLEIRWRYFMLLRYKCYVYGYHAAAMHAGVNAEM